MNTPNKLTVLRIFMIPVFVFFLFSTNMENNFLYANIVFILASLTDALDGYIARKHNLITDFGKFLDPLADKLLVMAGFISFIELGLSSSIVVLIIISRELLVTSLRLVASGSGIVIAANIWGKIKTIAQMVVIMFVLTLKYLEQINLVDMDINTISQNLMWAVAVITVVSGITYLWDNRKCIDCAK